MDELVVGDIWYLLVGCIPTTHPLALKKPHSQEER